MRLFLDRQSRRGHITLCWFMVATALLLISLIIAGVRRTWQSPDAAVRPNTELIAWPVFEVHGAFEHALHLLVTQHPEKLLGYGMCSGR